MAIPAVLAFLVLALPVVFTLFMRSHSALRWVLRIQNQSLATSLALEGEAAAHQVLLAGTGLTSGTRTIPEGGMQFRIKSLGTGPAGKPIEVVVGEGVYMGEEALVVSEVEVSTSGGRTTLVPYDREWVTGPGGGTPVLLEELVAEYQTRIAAYMALIEQESQANLEEFLDPIQAEAAALECPDVTSQWQQIQNELIKAKVN